MNTKVIFLDVDGTLYDHKHNEIPSKHIQAIQELQAKGIKVCLCTGRALPLIENLGILHSFQWDGIVCGNGSYVFNQNMECIFKDVMNYDDLLPIYKEYENKKSILAAGNCLFLTYKDEYSLKVLNDFHINDVEIRNIQKSDEFCVISLCVKDSTQHLEFLDQLDNVDIIYTNATIDVVKKGQSKYEGIRQYMKHYGYDEHDYIGFGDGMNDLEMLKNAKVGVVMGNGDPRLKEMMKYICPPCEEGGIYTFLKEMQIL